MPSSVSAKAGAKQEKQKLVIKEHVDDVESIYSDLSSDGKNNIICIIWLLFYSYSVLYLQTTAFYRRLGAPQHQLKAARILQMKAKVSPRVTCLEHSTRHNRRVQALEWVWL